MQFLGLNLFAIVVNLEVRLSFDPFDSPFDPRTLWTVRYTWLASMKLGPVREYVIFSTLMKSRQFFTL